MRGMCNIHSSAILLMTAGSKHVWRCCCPGS